jgi:hypothetical protein
VRWPEIVVAALFALGGVRSVIYHARRPFDSTDVRDQLLYALYLTGRVGMWFAFAGMFVIFAFAGASDPVTGVRVPSTGQVYVDDVSRYRAYVLVFAVLGAMQLLGSWFLGHRGGSSRSEEEDGSTRRP